MKRMCRHILVALCLSLWLIAQAAEYTYITYKGTITITGYTGPGGVVAIPDTIAGLPVHSIGNGAFSQSINLTAVTIPNNIAIIGSSAFKGCTGLTSVTIGNSVISIGDGAFSGCTNLTSITLPERLLSFGSYLLEGLGQPVDASGLRAVRVNESVMITGFNYPTNRVTVPSTVNGRPVTSIGNKAFLACTNLTSITIPESVISIGGWSFSGCTSLTNITIPNNVAGIGWSAFKGCTRLASVTIGNSVTNIGIGAFASCTSLTSLTIPNTVTRIEPDAFHSCTSLTSVNIGNSLTNIGDRAFYACSCLSSITLPNSVTSIGNWAFNGCSNLTGVYFQGNAPSVGAGVFEYADRSVTYYLPGTTGWDTAFGGRRTAVWVLPNPVILNGSAGIQTNQFGFTISWATNLSVVVEASTTLTTPTWSPLGTSILSSGSAHFSDPQFETTPARFYRIRSP